MTLYKKILTIVSLIILILISCIGLLKYQWMSVDRSKKACSSCEADANNIETAINHFYSTSKENKEPTKEDISKVVTTHNPFIFNVCKNEVTVHIIDANGKCSKEYQENYPEWNNNIYTKKIKMNID